jgi:hypothetical protein
MEQFDQKKSSRRLGILALGFVSAALRHQKTDQTTHCVVVRMTDQGRGFANLTNEPDSDQRLDVMG